MKKIITSLLLVCIMILTPAASSLVWLTAGLSGLYPEESGGARLKSLAFAVSSMEETNSFTDGDSENVNESAEAASEMSGPQVISEAAVLMDAESGQVLFEKNMQKTMYPASITKILTALIAIEQGDPDQIITMSEEAVFSIERGSSHIALDVGEQITLEQALYGISIASGNDAANGIAEAIGGSMEEFAVLMNQRAAEAGAENSNFVNAHGLPDDRHHTTAFDMARIMREAIRHPFFLELFSAEKYEIPPTNEQPEVRVLHNANCLINGEIFCDGIIAGKTGYTNAARHTLVTAAERDGRTLICVVMKSEGRNDKFNDTQALLNYGFDEFREVTIPSEQIKTATAPAEGGNDYPEAIYNCADDQKILLHQDLDVSDIEIEYILPASSQSAEQKSSAVIRLNDSASKENLMYYKLAQVPLTGSAIEQPDGSGQIDGGENLPSSNNDDSADRLQENSDSAWLKFVLAGAAIIVLVVLAIIWRRYRIIKHRQKIRRLREQYGLPANKNIRRKK